MACYIAWYGKKRQQLRLREREFIELLKRESNPSRIEEATEEVRAAHIRTLRATRARLAPSEKNMLALANLDREIQCWRSLSCEEIIEGYRTGKLMGHRANEIKRIRKERRRRGG